MAAWCLLAATATYAADLLPPADLQVQSTGGRVTLTWKASPDPDVAVYTVYRSDVGGFLPGISNEVARTSAAIWMETGLVGEGLFYYRVTARNAAGEESPASNEVAVLAAGDSAAPLISTMPARNAARAADPAPPDPANFTATELLSRPTASSIVASTMADAAMEAYYEFGTQPDVFPAQTATFTGVANQPLKILLSGLSPDTGYFYRLVYRKTGAATWIPRDTHSFHTQRAPGSAFTFTITADSHVNILLGDANLLGVTMQNIAADHPDLHLDLGDTFAMDNVLNATQADNAYLYQRPFFGQIGHSTPVLLALGNHEEEEAWHLNDSASRALTKPIMGGNARKKYFPNPIPDAFYRGNSDNSGLLSGDHLREDYYAFEWGDALFVTIDPYWYTTTKPFLGNLGGGEASQVGSGDRWDWTLGRPQYDWLKQTLEASGAKFKFVFAHHGTGGTDDYIRAGAYGAPFTEWGGYNVDGVTYGFPDRRAGWPATVHQLLVDNNVSVFFHGHDHEYAYELLDNIVYQLLPMAADKTYGFGFQDYRESDPLTKRVLPNSGYLRVTVSGAQTKVEYVRSFLNGDGPNGDIAHSYTIAPSAVATPRFSLAPGIYKGPQTMQITTATPDAEIHYTLDGKEPTAASRLYQGSLDIVGSATLKAIAVKPGQPNSKVASAQYGIASRRRR